jgi:hypothetical protein
MNGDDGMPALRFPRLTLPAWLRRGGTPGEENDRLVRVAVVAGFVVVTGIIAAFVLMVANSSGTGSAAPNPPVPTITDPSTPASTGTRPANPAPVPPAAAKPIAPSTVGKQAQLLEPKPKPRPAPPKPAPSPPPSSSSSQPPPPTGNGHGHGGDQIARPFDPCSPEGAHAVTGKHHFPLVCRGGQWQFASTRP